MELHPNIKFLAAMHWRIHPLKPNGKTPFLKNWPQIATSDIQQLAIWSTQFPNCNWGVATGAASGFFVVDIDGEDGKSSVAQLKLQGFELPETLTVYTGKGLHLYYAVPANTQIQNSVSGLGAGLDIRGDGGFVVIPPSVHESGMEYAFAPCANAENPIAAAPDWLLQRVMKREAPPAPFLPIVERREATEHERNTAHAALRDEVKKLSAMQKGQHRNAALNTAALHMGEIVAAGWIERKAVEAALMDASQQNGYIAQDGKAEAWKTLQSGLNAGFNNPRAALPADAPLMDFSAIQQKLQSTINQPPAPDTQGESVEVVSMSAIVPERIGWLWKDYLPLGKLVLLAGAAGTGKSTIAFSFAATVSNGGIWPDNSRCNAGHVLIFSTEDDAQDTIAPRLIAMNANPANVHLITKTITTVKGKLPFNPATDMPLLKDTVKKCGSVSLLIIDPIVTAITGDMNKSNEVRRGLQSIVDFASELNCAVVGITHFSKGTTGQNPADRVIGSVAFGAFARIVLVAAKDEESDNRVFTRAKSNIGIDTGGFYYGIQPLPIGNGITATRIAWGGEIKGTSREILAIVEHTDDSPHSSIADAKRFLDEELKYGPRPSKQLLELAKSQIGINEKTLQRARQQLGIETFKDGMTGGWIWRKSFTVDGQSINQIG